MSEAISMDGTEPDGHTNWTGNSLLTQQTMSTKDDSDQMHYLETPNSTDRMPRFGGSS